jgi:UDP-N-acetyl-D-glucosamine dehydrogenase
MQEISVIGLGYVGLPLAVQAAEKGYKVNGIDYNKELVDTINDRRSPYVNDVRFERALSRVSLSNFNATSSYENIANSDTVIICVPTPTENNVPDLSIVSKASEQVAEHLREGQLIVLESTVNPGATRSDVLPTLENISGLKAGNDFSLAHCPERIDPGNDRFHVGNLNRVVGGMTPACTDKATSFYNSIIDAKILPLGSLEEAEFVKSWENSHRNVMIALANTAAILCDSMDMNIDNVLQGLNSKVEQFGLSLASPGIGVGGHCIPEDIHYVIRSARESGIDTRFLDSAADLNDKMPRYAVHQLQELVAERGNKLEDLNVALLGLAYKPNIGDARRSPAIEVAHQLARYSNSLSMHDPFAAKTKETIIHGARRYDTIEETLSAADVVFIGTAHDEYITELTPDLLKRHGIKYLYDGRNCIGEQTVTSAGVIYQGVGR